MARAVSLPDPITAADASTWPELVTTPALIDFGTGTSALVETYEATDETGARVAVAHLRMIGDGVSGLRILLDGTMLRGLLIALQAADRELSQCSPVIPS